MEALPFSKESIYQLDGKFTDDSGRPFALGELRGRPVVLDLFFASCGYACPLTITDMKALREKLPATVRDRARAFLRRRHGPVEHSMLLEDQKAKGRDSEARLDEIVRETNPRLFWDER